MQQNECLQQSFAFKLCVLRIVKLKKFFGTLKPKFIHSLYFKEFLCLVPSCFVKLSRRVADLLNSLKIKVRNHRQAWCFIQYQLSLSILYVKHYIGIFYLLYSSMTDGQAISPKLSPSKIYITKLEYTGLH